MKKLNLNVGLADVIAYQNEKMDISIFLKNISGMELVTMTFTRHSQMDGLYHEK